MNYTLYRLRFTAPVHFGNGRLGKTEMTFYADTLFSALCTEAQKMHGNGAAELYDAAVSGRLRISDGLPYCSDTLFVPKPMTAVESSESGDSKLKKAFKKLHYIPLEDIDAYLGGEYDPQEANKMLDTLGKTSEQARVAVGRGDDSEPYSVGTFTFDEECGLYFIGAGDDDTSSLLDEIIDNLSYIGIGGKISSGLGRFEYSYEDVPDELLKRIEGTYDRYMSLSVCMAADEELESVVEGSGYELIRRSGFVASSEYSETALKKRDFYSFKAGACFSKRFEGGVFDVSAGGTHPVYRYAIPMLMGL